mgnify:CR=1 FL=1
MISNCFIAKENNAPISDMPSLKSFYKLFEKFEKTDQFEKTALCYNYSNGDEIKINVDKIINSYN